MDNLGVGDLRDSSNLFLQYIGRSDLIVERSSCCRGRIGSTSSGQRILLVSVRSGCGRIDSIQGDYPLWFL